MEIVNANITSGTILHIYSSQDGEIWENLETTCTVDNQNMCEFATSHLTFFTVGYIIWDNYQFLNPTFWNQNPAASDIIKALYGSGTEGTVYTS
jgi:hypothetical protein